MGIRTEIANKDMITRIIDLKAGDCFIFIKGNTSNGDKFHYMERDFEDNDLSDMQIDIRDKDAYYETILDSYYVFLVTKEYSIEHPFIEILNINTMEIRLLSDDNSIYYSDIKKVKRTSLPDQSVHLMLCQPSEIRREDKFLWVTDSNVSICTCFDDGIHEQSDDDPRARSIRFFNEHFSIFTWGANASNTRMYFIKILDCPETTVTFALS